MGRFVRGAWPIALAVLLAACGGNTTASPTDTNHVEMPPGYLFDPAAIRVTVGMTVTWHNSDNFTHSVRLLNESNVNKVVRPGESVTITFDRAGTYRFDCAFHPQQMRGTVEVITR